MAYFDSSYYTAQVAGQANFAASPNRGNQGGPLHVVHASITLTSATADGDILRICHLPQGAKVVPALSKVQCHADPGTTLVLDVGTAADVDAYADGLVLSNGGAVAFDANVCEQAKTPARLTANTLVYATVPTSGASSVTNGSVLTFWIAYTLG